MFGGLRLSSLCSALCCLGLVLACSGCGDDSNGGAGSGGTGGSGATAGGGGASGAGGDGVASCPMLAETWVIEEHCLPGFATEEIPFDQAGCSLVVRGAFSGLEGSVGENGEISLSGALGAMAYACEGTTDGSQMNLVCTTDCPVRLVAQ